MNPHRIDEPEEKPNPTKNESTQKKKKKTKIVNLYINKVISLMTTNGDSIPTSYIQILSQKPITTRLLRHKTVPKILRNFPLSYLLTSLEGMCSLKSFLRTQIEHKEPLSLSISSTSLTTFYLQTLYTPQTL